MEKVYGLRCEISSVCTNIHSLYRQLKQDEGFSDLIMVLRERLSSRLTKLEDLEFNRDRQHEIERIKKELLIIDRPFSSVYLVFDSELHHCSKKAANSMAVVKNNIAELKDMLEFFNNETEHGKLYVNYPMMESYRDCDDYFDKDYKDRFVSLDILFGKTRLKGYKSAIGSRKLANIRIGEISEEQFNRLTCMNIFKLNWMKNRIWGKPPYDEFLKQVRQDTILDLVYQYCHDLGAVAVLNTLLFFIVEYRGQDFYNNAICPE